jgi:hypothetical protein
MGVLLLFCEPEPYSHQAAPGNELRQVHVAKLGNTPTLVSTVLPLLLFNNLFTYMKLPQETRWLFTAF